MNEGHLQGGVAAVADNLGANLNQLRRAPSLWHATIQGIGSKQDSATATSCQHFCDYRPWLVRSAGEACLRSCAREQPSL
jgi:hypothetical protein